MPLTAAIREMLGIDEQQQPANYYHLLGISPDETSRDVIEDAAFRQAMRVEAFQATPWEWAVAPLLELLEKAKACLVDPVERQAYDQSRSGAAVAAGGVPAVEAPLPSERLEWTLGASRDCDIIIDDPYVSRRHCRIVQEEGKYWIEDLDSCNGTFVDGERVVRRKELSLNDSIGLGKTLRIAWNQFVSMQQQKQSQPDKPVLVHVARRTICFADGRPLDGTMSESSRDASQPEMASE